MTYLRSIPFYLALAVFLGYLSQAPSYNSVAKDESLILLSLSHYGDREQACKKLTPAEIAKLPPNMRRSQKCSRKRIPIRIELEINGELVYAENVSPTGLGKDGPSVVYEKFWVKEGEHKITLRIRDQRDQTGFDWQKSATVALEASQKLIVDFRPDIGPWFRHPNEEVRS